MPSIRGRNVSGNVNVLSNKKRVQMFNFCNKNKAKTAPEHLYHVSSVSLIMPLQTMQNYQIARKELTPSIEAEQQNQM